MSHAVTKLPVGRDGLFWMGRFMETTTCVLTPARHVDAYTERVRSVIEQYGLPDQMTHGVLSHLSTGSFVFSTEDNVARSRNVYASLCRAAETVMLPNLTIVQMKGEQIVDTGMVQNISADQAALTEIQRGARGFFCILSPKASSTVVLLDTDVNRIKSRAQAQSDSNEPLLRGQMRYRNAEGILLRSAQPTKTVRRLMMRWLVDTASAWPSFSPMFNAQYLQAA